MLNEIQSVQQKDGEPHKRWFNDADFDLFTWQRADGSVCRFQLCYDKQQPVERAVSWDAREGLNTYSVDDGEQTGRHKMSPMMVASKAAIDERVTRQFRRAARNLEPAIVAAVCARLGLPPVGPA